MSFDATAIVALLPTSQGGRAGPTPPTQFGCVLKSDARNFDVRLRLSEPLELGTARRVELDVLYPQTALAALKPVVPFSL